MDVASALRDRLIPLCFILSESSSASMGTALRYVLPSANTYLDAVLIESGAFEFFVECSSNLRPNDDNVWYSMPGSTVPLLQSLPLGVLADVLGNKTGPITIHVHFSPIPQQSDIGLETRPHTLYLNAVKCELPGSDGHENSPSRLSKLQYRIAPRSTSDPS